MKTHEEHTGYKIGLSIPHMLAAFDAAHTARLTPLQQSLRDAIKLGWVEYDPLTEKYRNTEQGLAVAEGRYI